MTERCPHCRAEIRGAVKFSDESFVFVCPECHREFPPDGAADVRSRGGLSGRSGR